MILDGTIVNADINSSAAIDWTKLAISSTISSTELGYLDGVTSAIQTQLNTLIPTGLISPFGAASAPAGWLSCQGQAVSRTTYSDLYAVIGTTYGIGDNSTTFNLPDLMGRSPIGSGTGAGLTGRSLGDKVGVENSSLSESNLPQHGHIVTHFRRISTADTHDHEGWSTSETNHFSAPPDDRTSEAESTDAVTVGTNGGNGSSAAFTNMQPSTAVNFIIKT
jgi:microcystin-dependent protein